MAFVFEEEPLPKKLNFYVWRRIGRYAFKKWPLLIFLAVFMLLTSFYDSAFIPLMNKAAIDAIGDGITGGIDSLIINVNIYGISFTLGYWGYCITLIVGLLLRSVAIYFTFFITNYLEMSIMLDLRKDSFIRIQELSFSYFDKTPSGWLIARMQNDTASLGDILSWGIIRLIWIGFDLVFTLITMFTVSWFMALIILATTPIIIIITPLFEMMMLRKNRIARSSYSNYVRWLAECISGSKTIKSLAIEDTVYNEAVDVTEEIRAKYFKARIIHAFFGPSIQMVSAATTAIVIAVGYYAFGAGSITSAVTISTLVLSISFVTKIYGPLQDFAELFAEFMASQAGAEKILSLIDTKPEIIDRPDVVEKYGNLFHEKKENYEKMEGSIDFDHVSFQYIKDIEVIHDMNLDIKKGQSIAIVGETGSGKSTTANLLCRFYEPSSGSIRIDGVDYRDRSVGWLRSNIGYVQQNPFIFSGTIRDNIKYGKLDATDEEIYQAAMIVDVHNFILSLPNGYDTVLHDGGSELSVGQKQLISFARAILRNPRIMILDEATSSIDTETEAEIQSAMRIILEGRTSIVIAHRLSTIINSDRILVMKDGLIVEDGSHAALMKQKGYYYHLYMNQFAELKLEEQIETYETQIEGLKLDSITKK